ncbi:MAG: cytochrome c3 family protein [Deltaproteobacteria bacterium]|nr:cytochrome c3 family protein [Deltaproteobacteria bacterium]
MSDYYEGFYKEVTKRVGSRKGVSQVLALDALPKDPAGNVNWTAAVVNGYINPRASLDPGVEDDPPLNLNIFIEAKVPLMANVIFPHSIHTYWLSCNNCHPKIFLPEAGANPISMDEIFKGEWCGRCHNKVAFAFWPRENCVRCHIVLKGHSTYSMRQTAGEKYFSPAQVTPSPLAHASRRRGGEGWACPRMSLSGDGGGKS